MSTLGSAEAFRQGPITPYGCLLYTSFRFFVHISIGRYTCSLFFAFFLFFQLFMGCLTFLKPRRYMVLFNFRQTVIMLEKDSPGANSIPLQSFLMGNDKRINYSDQYPIPGLYSEPMMPSLSKS